MYKMDDKLDKIKTALGNANHFLIIQADNPDADSLGSALALEQILGEAGNKVDLYCGVDIPGYLKYMAGWDRVQRELPKQFDASIIVDASTLTLLEKIQQDSNFSHVKSNPLIVLDHHLIVESEIDFAEVIICNSNLSSTGELIFSICQSLNLKVDVVAGAFIMSAILGDTQGLSNDLAQSSTFRTMAELVDLGVSRSKLEENRRLYSKMPQLIFKYKSALIARTEFYAEGRISIVVIPQNEIKQFSALYNPGPLIQNDMLQVEGVQLAIVIKQYDDGKVTGAIRSNVDSPISAELAQHLGGGGHAYASGFKVTSGKKVDAIINDCVSTSLTLFDNLKHK